MTHLLLCQSVFDVYRDSSEVIEPIQESKTIVNAPEVSETNPFEVSHIPLRKNQQVVVNNEQIPVAKRKKQSGTSSELENYIPLSVCGASAFLLGLLLFYNRSLAAEIIQAIMNFNYMQSFRAKMTTSLLPQSACLYLIFFANMALFIMLCYRNFSSSDFKIQIFLLMGLVALVYLGRHLLLRVFGWIFELNSEAGSFSFVIALINFALGIVLIPINLFIAFAPANLSKVVVFIGLLLVLMFLIFRYFRGLLIANKHIFNSTFQFFLYFCTFEIAPVLILFQIIVGM